jgi:hypothetical protein
MALASFQAYRYIIWWIALLLAACRAPIAPPTGTPVVLAQPPAFVGAEPDEALPALLRAERQGAIDRDLELLTQLWASDGRIVDGRSTPATDDDYIWNGHAAVLDRYLVAVFPNPPPPLEATAPFSFTFDGDFAYLHNGVDDWTFVHRDNRWWLLELNYN